MLFSKSVIISPLGSAPKWVTSDFNLYVGGLDSIVIVTEVTPVHCSVSPHLSVGLLILLEAAGFNTSTTDEERDEAPADDQDDQCSHEGGVVTVLRLHGILLVDPGRVGTKHYN